MPSILNNLTYNCADAELNKIPARHSGAVISEVVQDGWHGTPSIIACLSPEFILQRSRVPRSTLAAIKLFESRRNLPPQFSDVFGRQGLLLPKQGDGAID